MPERVQVVSLAHETQARYRTYALSVITGRALPDVRDGLKPVQRRILFNMFADLHLHADERPVKSAKVVGDVMANYHPHGDMAIYDTLVRLAQPFTLRYPLIHGEGNFGSVDGQEPAAYRYTECRLLPLAEELLVELRQQTVDLKPTYDGTRQEPVVLPARFPQLLVNGATGIAVGMATNIPPHNLREVCNAAMLLIDEPEATTAQLLDKVKGPDFPLGGRILADKKTLRRIYEEGQGSIKIQAEWKVEEVGKRKQIVCTSIPFGVNKGALEEHIGGLIADKGCPPLLNITNESNAKEGIRIVLEIKPDADPNIVMAYLFKHSALQQNFAVNLNCLVPVPASPAAQETETGAEPPPAAPIVLKPRRLGLRDMLRYFLDFRLETVRRRFRYLLQQLRQRIHLLEGFRLVFNALDRVLALIRGSQGKADAAQRLMSEIGLDAVQAEAVLELLLYKIAKLEIKKILEELKEKRAEAERIEGILRSEKKLWSVVRQELEELAEKYGDRRRSRLASEEDAPEYSEEAYIVRENTHVILTREGWIKRVGRLTSIESTRVREGDAVLAVLPASTLDQVIFFSDDGLAFTMRANEVPASSGYGEPLTKFFRLSPGAKIVAALTTDPRFTPPDQIPGADAPTTPHLLSVTAQGQIVRGPLLPFRPASTVKGRLYLRLADGDKVVFVSLVLPETRSVMLASAQGRVLHFALDEVPVLAGIGKGVMGLRLDAGDRCLGAALIRNQNDALVVETSSGKKLEFYGSRELASRGAKGFAAVKRVSLVRVVPPPITQTDWDALDGRAERRVAPVQGELFHGAAPREPRGDQG